LTPTVVVSRRSTSSALSDCTSAASLPKKSPTLEKAHDALVLPLLLTHTLA
jgi:hypothetical protein